MIKTKVILVAVCTLCSLPPARADAPKTPDGVPIVSWKNAAQYYHQEAVVYGKVVLTRNIGTHTFLNFDPDYRNHFTVLIKKEHYDRFPQPAEKTYAGKLVAVRGEVVPYQQKPEIIATSPAQIVILPDNTLDVVAALTGQLAGANQAPVAAGTSVTVTRTLTIATLNFESLLQANNPFCAEATATGPATAELAVAGILHALNADIVAIENAGLMACLQRFNQTQLRDLNYNYQAGDDNPQTGQADTAVLSRLPIEQQTRITTYSLKHNSTDTFKRPLLEVSATTPDGAHLKVVVVNLPGKDTGMTLTQRLREIRGLRRYVEDELTLNADVRLVLCGGFGENLSSKPLAALTAGDLLTVPGYARPADVGGTQPRIMQCSNFVLVSPAMIGLYQAGSTRIEHTEPTAEAVAVGFEVSAGAGMAPQPVPPPHPAPQPQPARRGDDF